MGDHRGEQIFPLLFLNSLTLYKDQFFSKVLDISGSLIGKLAFIEKAVLGKLIWLLLILFFLQLLNQF